WPDGQIDDQQLQWKSLRIFIENRPWDWRDVVARFQEIAPESERLRAERDKGRAKAALAKDLHHMIVNRRSGGRQDPRLVEQVGEIDLAAVLEAAAHPRCDDKMVVKEALHLQIPVGGVVRRRYRRAGHDKVESTIMQLRQVERRGVE